MATKVNKRHLPEHKRHTLAQAARASVLAEGGTTYAWCNGTSSTGASVLAEGGTTCAGAMAQVGPSDTLAPEFKTLPTVTPSPGSLKIGLPVTFYRPTPYNRQMD
jgi:hypothetical protein